MQSIDSISKNIVIVAFTSKISLAINNSEKNVRWLVTCISMKRLYQKISIHNQRPQLANNTYQYDQSTEK